jgi:hypothetical protein
LEHRSLTNDLAPFQTFMHQLLDATLEDYLNALRESSSTQGI